MGKQAKVRQLRRRFSISTSHVWNIVSGTSRAVT